MPSREITVDGRTWRVYPSGFITQSVADEFSLIFVSRDHDGREVRLTRYTPRNTRAREAALAEMTDADIVRLFYMSQPSVRAPEAGYRA